MLTSSELREVVVLDFETTGLAPPAARVIEIGAVRLRDGKVCDTFHALTSPGCRLPPFITGLTGITDAMLHGKPAPEHVMPAFREFLGNAPLVAHNAAFDAKFLRAEMGRAGFVLNNPVLCTLRLARRLLPETPRHGLGNLALHLGITSDGAHRALADAKVTSQVWLHLLGIAAGIADSSLDLQFLQDLSKKPKAAIERKLRAQALSGATCSSSSGNSSEKQAPPRRSLRPA